MVAFLVFQSICMPFTFPINWSLDGEQQHAEVQVKRIHTKQFEVTFAFRDWKWTYSEGLPLANPPKVTVANGVDGLKLAQVDVHVPTETRSYLWLTSLRTCSPIVIAHQGLSSDSLRFERNASGDISRVWSYDKGSSGEHARLKLNGRVLSRVEEVNVYQIKPNGFHLQTKTRRAIPSGGGGASEKSFKNLDVENL